MKLSTSFFSFLLISSCFFIVPAINALITGKINDNGPYYILKPSNGPVSLRLSIPVGFLHEKPHEAGSAQTIAQYNYNHLAELELINCSVNVKVSGYQTIYSIDELDPIQIPAALHIFHSIITEPCITIDDINQLNTDKPPITDITDNQLILFDHTPFAIAHTICHNPTILKNFYENHYLTQHSTIIATGFFETEDILNNIQAILCHNFKHPHPYYEKKLNNYFNFPPQFPEKQITFQFHDNSDIQELFFNLITLTEAPQDHYDQVNTVIRNLLYQHLIDELILLLFNDQSAPKIQHQLHYIYPGYLHHQIHIQKSSNTHLFDQLSLIFSHIKEISPVLKSALINAKEKIHQNINAFISNFDELDAKSQSDQFIYLLNHHILSITDNLDINSLESFKTFSHEIINNIHNDQFLNCFQHEWFKSHYYCLIKIKENPTDVEIYNHHFETLKTTFFYPLSGIQESQLTIPKLTYSYCFDKHNFCTFHFENEFHLNLAGGHSPDNTLIGFQFGSGYQTHTQKKTEFIWLLENVFLEYYSTLLNITTSKNSFNNFNNNLQTDTNRFILYQETSKTYLPETLKTIHRLFNNSDNFFKDNDRFQKLIIQNYKKFNALNSHQLLNHYLSNTAYGYQIKDNMPSLNDLLNWSVENFETTLQESLLKSPLSIHIVGDYLSNNEIHELNTYVIAPIQEYIAPLQNNDFISNNDKSFNNQEILFQNSLKEYLYFEDENSHLSNFCIYWKIDHDHNVELITKLEVISHWYARLIEKELYTSWDNFYKVHPFVISKLNTPYILFGCSIEIHPSDIENIEIFIEKLIHKINISNELHFQSFENTLHAIIQDTTLNFIKEIYDNDNNNNEFDFSQKVETDLNFLINTAKTMINTENLSNHELLNALKFNLSTIGHYLKIIYKNKSIDFLENTFYLIKNNFFETIINEKNSSSKSIFINIENNLNDIKIATKEYYRQKSELIDIYNDLYFLTFIFCHDFQQKLHKIELELFTTQKNNIINDSIISLKTIFTHNQISYEHIEDFIKQIFNSIHEIKMFVLACPQLKNLLHQYEENINKLNHKLKNLNTSINYQHELIDNHAQNITHILNNFTADQSTNHYLVDLFKDVHNHINHLKKLKIAYEKFDVEKQNTLYKAWKLLNPIAISDGHIDQQDNNLLTAIQSALAEQMPYLYSPHYWLRDILLVFDEHPENLNWAENISEYYENINLKDIQFIMKHLLSPKEMHTVNINSKSNVD